MAEQKKIVVKLQKEDVEIADMKRKIIEMEQGKKDLLNKI